MMLEIISGEDILKLPENGEEVTIRILSPPRGVYIDVYIDDDRKIAVECIEIGKHKRKELIINSTIYKGMMYEFEKYKIDIDINLICMVGIIFKIKGRLWDEAPKNLWKMSDKGESIPPITFATKILNL